MNTVHVCTSNLLIYPFLLKYSIVFFPVSFETLCGFVNSTHDTARSGYCLFYSIWSPSMLIGGLIWLSCANRG